MNETTDRGNLLGCFRCGGELLRFEKRDGFLRLSGVDISPTWLPDGRFDREDRKHPLDVLIVAEDATETHEPPGAESPTGSRMIDSRAFARMTLVDRGLDNPGDLVMSLMVAHIDRAIENALEEFAAANDAADSGQSMLARKIAQREEAAKQQAASAGGALGSGMNHEPPGD